MMTTKQARETRRAELVETHNIALSIKRLQEVAGHDAMRWRRSLYHALGMNYIDTRVMEEVRKALGLP